MGGGKTRIVHNRLRVRRHWLEDDATFCLLTSPWSATAERAPAEWHPHPWLRCSARGNRWKQAALARPSTRCNSQQSQTWSGSGKLGMSKCLTLSELKDLAEDYKGCLGKQWTPLGMQWVSENAVGWSSADKARGAHTLGKEVLVPRRLCGWGASQELEAALPNVIRKSDVAL